MSGIILLACLISLVSYYYWMPMVTDERGRDFDLRAGISKHEAIAQLALEGVISHPLILTMFTSGQKNALKTGEYHFVKGSTLRSIWQQLITGRGLRYHPFTLVPEWTFRQLRAGLNKAEGLRHLTEKLGDSEIMHALGAPSLSPEGEFFPETYNYTRGNTDLGLLKRAFVLMQSRLQKAWAAHSANLPYQTAYEALILASMIEKEAYLDKERPIIAGVLMNRLANNMLLQIDATVIYGLGDQFTGKIYKENLAADTAYNTYLHRGLPPTPIAMPCWASLQAATRPQQNEFFYYVAKGDGSHQFSDTLQAHHDAIKHTRQELKDANRQTDQH